MPSRAALCCRRLEVIMERDFRPEPPPRPRWRAWLMAGLAALAAGAIAPAVPAQAPVQEPELPPLTTDANSPRLPGKFIWADLATSNVDAAQQFYGQMFGWQFRPVGTAATGYTLIYNGDRAVGGIVSVRARAHAPSAPRWIGYISVPDVAQAAQAIGKAGGNQLVDTKSFPKRGEQAVFVDAEGAVFGVMKSSSGDPGDFLAEPGDWIWIQLLSRDIQKATNFYRAIAGYEVVETTRRPGHPEYLLVSGAFARAAVSQLSSNRRAALPAWLPFVRVADLSQALTKAQQLKATIMVRPRPELFDGRMAVLADPNGAAIGLVQWDDETDQERKRRP
jgi:predicted enzyme related to lactoylglutathione lyase